MLAERYLRRRYEEGVQDLAEKVKEWNKRRLEAESRGEKFDEPPPTKV